MEKTIPNIFEVTEPFYMVKQFDGKRLNVLATKLSKELQNVYLLNDLRISYFIVSICTTSYPIVMQIPLSSKQLGDILFIS